MMQRYASKRLSKEERRVDANSPILYSYQLISPSFFSPNHKSPPHTSIFPLTSSHYNPNSHTQPYILFPLSIPIPTLLPLHPPTQNNYSSLLHLPLPPLLSIPTFNFLQTSTYQHSPPLNFPPSFSLSLPYLSLLHLFFHLYPTLPSPQSFHLFSPPTSTQHQLSLTLHYHILPLSPSPFFSIPLPIPHINPSYS